MGKIEILSPCGGPESVDAALRTGADAVYLGARKFSARHNAVNFSDEELFAAVRECHRHGVLVYLAFNTVLRDSELEEAAGLLKLACEAGVDGLIIQDMAVYETARAACPDMPLHASTQMTVHTPCGVDSAAKLGFKRVVAARELSLEQIKELCGRGVEIEVFAHGALCMCVSGQCYLSAMIGGRSANRGLCAGACRLPFSAAGKPSERDFALSLKDMSYCDHINELEEAGVKSLKIEGRMKRPEYVAAATDALSRARRGDEVDYGTLRAVFSRSGFTDGYLTGKLGSEMFGAREKEDVTAAASALPKLQKLYEKPEKRFKLDIRFTARRGEPMRLEVSDGELSAAVSGDIPEEARTRETTAHEIEAQLIKLGGTLYYADCAEVTADGGLAISLSKINALRREAVERLDEARIEKMSQPKSFNGGTLSFAFPLPLIRKRPEFRIRVERIEQLSRLELRGEDIVIPLGAEEEYLSAGYDPERAVIALPRFDNDEKITASRLKTAKNLGFSAAECGNIGHIELASRLGFKLLGGFGLNIANSLAARHYFLEGLETLTLSPELKASQCSKIACPGRLGAVIYGRLPLMLTRNCPIAAQVGCKNCTRRLKDRTGAEFPIICRRESGYFELLNSRPIWLADRLDDFNLDFGDLMFTTETSEQAARVLRAYRSGAEPQVEFTRGMYYRGVE